MATGATRKRANDGGRPVVSKKRRIQMAAAYHSSSSDDDDSEDSVDERGGGPRLIESGPAPPGADLTAKMNRPTAASGLAKKKRRRNS